MLTGWDADRLALDPVMRQVGGGRCAGGFGLADGAALVDLNGQWIDRFHDRCGLKYSALDMDRSVSPTHGEQEGTAWNGHFDCTCYHPLFVFNQFGMLERCAMRHGNGHSAGAWRDVLDPVIARYAERNMRHFFRADAAYASPAIYARLDEAGYLYAIRLPANAVLRGQIAHRLTRPVGRPSLTKVKRLYNQRGTARQHIRQGNYAFHWTRLSCKRFRDTEVRLQRHPLACNLATFLRCIELPGAMAADQPPAQADQDRADQDRGPRRASRPRHHLPVGRGRGHRSDGAGILAVLQRHRCARNGDPDPN